MQRVLIFAVGLLCLASLTANGAGKPDEQYIEIFNTIMSGDDWKSKGNGKRALEMYLFAEDRLKKLKSAYPTWNGKIVNFRLDYLKRRIGPLNVQYPGTTIPASMKQANQGEEEAAAAKAEAGPGGVYRDLNDRLINVHQQNSKLRDQLREALAARPADSDPTAYAKAQERIRALEKNSDVSTVTMGQQNDELEKLRKDYASLQKRTAVLADRNKEAALKGEIANLKAQLQQLNSLTQQMPNADEMKRRLTLLETDLKTAQSSNQDLLRQNQQLSKQLGGNAEVAKLQRQNQALQQQIAGLSKIAGEVGSVEGMKTKLRLAQAELDAQKAFNADLTTQNKSLETKIRSNEVPQLRAANAALQQEVSKLRDVTKSIPEVETLQSELATAKAKIAAEQAMRASLAKEKEKLESLLTDPNTQIGKGPSDEVQSLEKEKRALEAQLKKLSDEANRAKGESTQLNQQTAAQKARLDQLERERVELRKALEKAMKDLEDQKKAAARAATTSTKSSSADAEAKKKLQVAEARIRALESKAEPYSRAELALMKGTPAEPERATPAPSQPKREFPTSAAEIALQAQRAYNARRYDEAEAKYLEVLSAEKNNVYTLANLAAAQMELNKLSEAESNLDKALKLHSGDAYSMALMGLVKFRKNDFDGALDMLSQAAVLDPKNAQTQNYLGLALSQKGLRIAAEAAFRKAVKLAPGYSVAHYNLAVFYATASSASPELARWHYQKATAAGHPKSPELEKLLVGR